MPRQRQILMIRAAAQAALEHHMLTPFDYQGLVQRLNVIERQNDVPADDQAIRQASEAMIRRLRQSVSAY
mgnify:CR=1 FL=1